MRLRIVASLVALIVLAAPTLLAACEIACAATQAASDPAQRHSCHDGAAASDAPAIGAGEHACGHAATLPAPSRAQDASAGPAVPIGAMLFATPVEDLLAIGSRSQSRRPPPGRLTPTIPLRI